MNSNDHFDELTRRKLEEARFPFEEEEWQRMHALILARQQARRNRRILALFLLLLTGSITWWTLDTHPLTPDSAPDDRTPPVAERTTPAAPRPAAPSGASSEVRPRTNLPSSEQSTGPDGEQGSPEAPTTRSTHGDPAPVAEAKTHGSTLPRPFRPVVRPIATTTDRPAPAAASPARPSPSPAVQASDDRNAPSANDTETTTPDRQAAGNTASDKDQSTATDSGTPGASDAAPSASTSTSEPQQVISAPSPSTPPTSTAAANLEAVPGTRDTTSTTAANDSSATILALADSAMPPAPALASVIPARAPWEITAWIGWQNSRITYSGNADWIRSQQISPVNTISGGLELMHMGKHLGLGTGLHYATYGERLDMDNVDRTDLLFADRWYLVPVDTTIFHTSGHLPGDLVEGFPLDTTINVITRTTDTTITVTRVRNARRTENRVSYVEIPLIADVHLTQGRWNLGLRGGPTLGLLSARRGLLPSANGENYIPLTDEPFRKLQFGYQASAYIRYRFHPAWSIGIGPGVRGHWGNGSERSGLERRTMAWSGLVGLTYRFP
ncbi:MAG TPA: hypothetical protein VGE21_12055 [Flavobacteriales bacterium]